MNIEAGIALDVLSIFYMLILILNLGHKSKKAVLDYQYVLIMMVVCIFLMLDAVYLLFYGTPDVFLQTLLKTVKSLYFIINCAIIWLWAKYIDYTIWGNLYKAKKHRIFYAVVFFTNTSAVIINFFTGFLFDISPEGTFVVGYAAMWGFTILNYLSVALVTIIVLKNRKEIEKSIFYPMLIFPLPPLCGEIVQLFFRHISLVCTYSLSALIVFQISQHNTIYTDELTGLANRRMLNEYLNKWFSEPKGSTICGIMIDLDSLKYINDTYGHLAGDNAIIHLAETIKSLKRKDIISARYGGDEFVLIWLSQNGDDVSVVKQSLESNRIKLNELYPKHEKIDFSMGGFCCHDSEPLTAEDFLRQMDRKMYQAKNQKKKNTATK